MEEPEDQMTLMTELKADMDEVREMVSELRKMLTSGVSDKDKAALRAAVQESFASGQHTGTVCHIHRDDDDSETLLLNEYMDLINVALLEYTKVILLRGLDQCQEHQAVLMAARAMALREYLKQCRSATAT